MYFLDSGRRAVCLWLNVSTPASGRALQVIPAWRRALRFQKQSTKRTAMPNPRLPAEILDHIIDHLHDTTNALRNCCLVSESWIPRTRKHLFADVKFHTVTDLRSWKKKFPDPSTSPGYYTETLIVRCPEVVAAADAEAGGWITAFSRVVHLWVGTRKLPTFPATLVPFHGLSPVVKSLSMILPTLESPHISNLILSFPLLEDLAVTIDPRTSSDDDDGDSDWLPPAAQPLSTPVFTGSLKILLERGMKHISHWLLALPGGIHFRKLILRWNCEEDLSLMMALVERCSHTLESLEVFRHPLGESIRHLRPHTMSQNCF